LTQERPEIRLRRLPRTRNSSDQPQARGAAPALRPSPDASETRSGHGEPSTAPVSAAHSPVSKRPCDLQRSAATCEGRGARCPPTVRPPTPASRQAHACAAFPPARAMPATAVHPHRGPPGPPSCPRWPPSGLLPPASTGCAARTSRTATRQSQAQPQPLWGPGLDAGALRQYIASLARREERQERDRWRPSSPAHCGTRTPSWGGSPRRLGRAASRSRQERQSRLPVGAVASGRAPYGGSGAREISGTGRAQRRRCLSCAPPGGRIEEARRSVCSSALPSRRGARTSPGSPAVRGGSPAATLTGTQFRLLVREPVMAWTPRRHCLGGVSHGAAVDDGGVGFWPARPHNPAASTPCRLGRCLRRSQVSLGHRSWARHGRRPQRFARRLPASHG